MTSKYDLPSWTYGIYTILSLDDMPEGTFGFVYHVKFSDNTHYLGKKQVISIRNVKKGKRELAAMEDKRGSKKKQVIKESDWLTYYGSIQLPDNVYPTNRNILEFAGNKAQLTYLEARWQFSGKVLESEEFRNDNILGKFYKKSTLWEGKKPKKE